MKRADQFFAPISTSLRCDSPGFAGLIQRSWELHTHSSYARGYIPKPIDLSLDPPTYYHSTGSMNPMKLIGILRHGILSKKDAEEKKLTIDSNGMGCNGSRFVSVATRLGGCMDTDKGAFHFAIDREKLKGDIRENPEEEMPLERQVSGMVPREAIKSIYLEKAGTLDLEHPEITLGIGHFNISRARVTVLSYIRFMITEFKHVVPTEDFTSIQTTLGKMESALNNTSLDFLAKEKICMQHERIIDDILKKHLKLSYQTVISKEEITPYDIIRYYDKDILICDFEGHEIHPLPTDSTHHLTH